MERTAIAAVSAAHALNHRVRGLDADAVARDDDRLRARGLLAHAHLREIAAPPPRLALKISPAKGSILDGELGGTGARPT